MSLISSDIGNSGSQELILSHNAEFHIELSKHAAGPCCPQSVLCPSPSIQSSPSIWELIFVRRGAFLNYVWVILNPVLCILCGLHLANWSIWTLQRNLWICKWPGRFHSLYHSLIWEWKALAFTSKTGSFPFKLFPFLCVLSIVRIRLTPGRFAFLLCTVSHFTSLRQTPIHHCEALIQCNFCCAWKWWQFWGTTLSSDG